MNGEGRTLQQTLDNLPNLNLDPLSVPCYDYNGSKTNRIALAVESMKRHTSDEGWQIMAGLEGSGYTLYGSGLPRGETNVTTILREEETDLGTIIVQDKKEWYIPSGSRSFRDSAAKFRRIGELADRPDLFRLTILRDAHFNPEFHTEAALEMGCHAWVIPYHPSIVHRLAPYVRPQHLVRTYHSIDPKLVPDFRSKRDGCLLSGAVGGHVYPLRTMLVRNYRSLPSVNYLKHPGYHRQGTNTPEYLRTLSGYKVALCTSSIYGYAVRKIIEATACGCIVVTDLPTDEVLPEIDNNLVRIHPRYPRKSFVALLNHLYIHYDPGRQLDFVERTKAFYDYRKIGERLANDIANLRETYPGAKI